MNTKINCIPCFYRQAVETARMAGADKALIKRIADKIGYNFRKFDLADPPPAISRKIQKIITSETRIADPYKKLKMKSNFWARGIRKQLQDRVETFNDKLLSAVHVAIAGNIMDYGANTELNLQEKIENILGMEETDSPPDTPLFAYHAFQSAVGNAQSILYLADNAGEAVFDGILLKQLQAERIPKKITFAVRQSPILNDCLEEDAFECGISDFAEIISTGCGAPGVIPAMCSEDFLSHFHTADIIISKGQGNFESLPASDGRIYFLFIVKCPVVADSLSCDLGQAVLLDNRRSLTA